jgi:hypothetical protein
MSSHSIWPGLALFRSKKAAYNILVNLGGVERALDLARSERRQWDRFSALRNVARAIAETQPALAVHILEEIGRLLDDKGVLEARQARMAAAKEILHLLPAHANVAQALIDEARQLNPQLSDVQQINYLVGYVLPVLTLSEGIDAALQACEDLPDMACARAFRTIAGELPSDHPSKRLLLEQALALLETLDPTPETLSSAIKCTVDLLAIVREKERPALLESIVSLGEELQAISESRDYAVWQNWAINRVAKIDLDWSKRMLLESSWGEGPDAYSGVIRASIVVDYREALRLIDEYMPNHILARALLVDVIGVVAREDIGKAKALMKTYAQQLKHNQRDVYVALAEGYLAQGNATKARELFDTHVVAVDAESIVHAIGDLKLAMLERASAFLTLDTAQQYTLPECRRCGENWKQKKSNILAFIAAREGNLDYLKSRDLGGDTEAKLTGAYHLAEHAGPEVAKDYLASQHIAPHSAIERVDHVYAHIITAEALQNPDRLSGLLEHFNDPERTHHSCAYMLELPAALEQLVVDKQIEPEKATAIIEPLFTRLLEWKCPRGGESAEDDFFRARCRCYDRCESVLEQLIGVMARLSLDRAEVMIDELPTQPIRVYAWLRIVARVPPDRTMVERITGLAQRYMTDPWQRVEVLYCLAMWLPPAMSDEAKALIALAEPLLSEKPTNYHTNRFGLPVRTGPSETELKKLKARALMNWFTVQNSIIM